jgi:hypothetical protein
VGFEPTIPVFERAETVHSLECAATVIGIRRLPEENQAYMTQLVVNNIQILINTENQKRNKTKHAERKHAEWRTIKNVIQKLINN